MVRDFSERPIEPAVLDRVLAAAFTAPSAGFSQGTELVVLEGPAQTSLFWDAVTTADWRATNESHAGSRRAPVVLLPLADPDRYLRRYSEPDKAASGLGTGLEAWPVPFWFIDSGFAVMATLLAAVEEGLGALFMGIFRGEQNLADRLAIPPHLRPLGAVVLGWPGDAAHRSSSSLARGRRAFEEVVHRGGYQLRAQA
jgi:nitroreductase